MVALITKLEDLLQTGSRYVSQSSESEMNLKVSDEKWSKKEILGHSIDSAINNLQRFTEIQFEHKPYKIRKYNQVALVKANQYQNSETKEIVKFWIAINTQIKEVIKVQTHTTLNYKIEVENGDIIDLRYLINDYVDHLEHHLAQIVNSS